MLLGHPSAYCLPDGTLQFFFCGSDNHIILTGPDGGRTDLSKGVNSTPPSAKGTPAPQMISGQLHIFYRDQNDHISDLWGGTPTPAFWQDLHDVIVKQGGQPPPLAISDPFAMGYPADGSKQLQVYYLGANNHICRFSINYGDKWVFTDLSLAIPAAIPPAFNPSPRAAVFAGGSGKEIHVCYRGISGEIPDLWGGGDTPSNWVDLRDSANARGFAASDLFPLMVYSQDFPAFGIAQRHVFYTSSMNQIWDIFGLCQGDWSWDAINLHEAVSPTPMPAAGVPCAVSAGTILVFYRDALDHISHLWFNRVSGWYPSPSPHYQDLNVIARAPLAHSDPSAVRGPVVFSDAIYLVYFDVNDRVALLSNSTGGWNYKDLGSG